MTIPKRDRKIERQRARENRHTDTKGMFIEYYEVNNMA